MYNILILHSQDGPQWDRAILYPEDWTPERADDEATAAFAEAQAANPDEWSWDDYEPLLIARGFLVPCWHHGPTWDEQVAVDGVQHEAYCSCAKCRGTENQPDRYTCPCGYNGGPIVLKGSADASCPACGGDWDEAEA